MLFSTLEGAEEVLAVRRVVVDRIVDDNELRGAVFRNHLPPVRFDNAHEAGEGGRVQRLAEANARRVQMRCVLHTSGSSRGGGGGATARASRMRRRRSLWTDAALALASRRFLKNPSALQLWSVR
jgi:hypothetical protein